MAPVITTELLGQKAVTSDLLLSSRSRPMIDLRGEYGVGRGSGDVWTATTTRDI